MGTTAMTAIRIKDEAHWRELRRPRIGASEVGALCGVSKRETPYELWNRKMGRLDEPDFENNERIIWGQEIEPAIARGVQRLRGWESEKCLDYHTSDRVARFGCTPDYVITGPEMMRERLPALMQIKNVGNDVYYRDWIDKQPPLDYELQVQAELACTNLQWGVLAVLVGGNSLKIYSYERHAGAIARIEREVELFWKSIDIGTPPVPNWERDAAAIAEIYRVADKGTTIQLSGERADELANLCEELEITARTQKMVELHHDGVRAQILDMIGSAEYALSPDWEIAARTTKDAHVPAHTKKGHRRLRVKRRRAPQVVLPPPMLEPTEE